jgi:uncharacterized protein (DUF302 family)
MGPTEEQLVIRDSPWPVAETVQRLEAVVAARGLKLFAVIDHSADARTAGLELRDTQVVIFGSPVAGTPVMHAAPLAALDLPLKVLVWDDQPDGTKVTYLRPEALTARYGLAADLGARLAGIEAVVDATLTA